VFNIYFTAWTYLREMILIVLHEQVNKGRNKKPNTNIKITLYPQIAEMLSSSVELLLHGILYSQLLEISAMKTEGTQCC